METKEKILELKMIELIDFTLLSPCWRAAWSSGRLCDGPILGKEQRSKLSDEQDPKNKNDQTWFGLATLLERVGW